MTVVFERPWEEVKEEMGKGRNQDTRKSVRNSLRQSGKGPLIYQGFLIISLSSPSWKNAADFTVTRSPIY